MKMLEFQIKFKNLWYVSIGSDYGLVSSSDNPSYLTQQAVPIKGDKISPLLSPPPTNRMQ